MRQSRDFDLDIQRVLELFEAQNPLSLEDLKTAFGRSSSWIHGLIKKVRDQGDSVIVFNGLYYMGDVPDEAFIHSDLKSDQIRDVMIEFIDRSPDGVSLEEVTIELKKRGLINRGKGVSQYLTGLESRGYIVWQDGKEFGLLRRVIV